MYLMIEIPKEFEIDFNKDKFEDCFQRLIADTRDRMNNHDTLMAGNYEIETLEMLIKSFKKAT